jgi:O-antigen/teichoic acid export membrane protein
MRRIAERLSAVFSRELGENTRRLLAGLASVGPLFVMARALTAVAQIAAGRLLGPAEFGVVTLILAGSGLMLFFLQLSFPWTVAKFAPLEKTEAGRRGVVSTSFWLQLLWSATAMLVLLILREPAAHALHLSFRLYLWCLGYTGVQLFYGFVSSALLAVTLFAARGKVELLYGAATLIVFSVGCLFASRNFVTFIGAMEVAMILSSAASLYYLRDYLGPVFSRRAASDLAPYLLPGFVSSCGGVVIQSALPLILAAYRTPREIGIFGAYEMGTIGVMMVLVNIILSVLTPLASRPERQKGVWKKFFLLCVPGAAAAFVFFFVSEIVILKLIGKGYPIDLRWIALFSAAAVADFYFFLTGSLLTLRDVSATWLGVVGSYLASAVALVVSSWGVPRLGIAGAALALFIGYGVGSVWLAVQGWLRVRNDP